MEKRALRNCGQIHGNLKEMQPFFYIASMGALLRDQRSSLCEEMKGIFIVNAVAGNGVCPKMGVIIPLSRCRDDKTRESLQKLQRLLSINKLVNDIGVHYSAIKMLLKDMFGDILQITEHQSLNGFVPFERTKGLFSLLTENFDYVTEIDDDPNGMARPTEFQPFAWKSYGEFLEWFHKVPTRRGRLGWDHCYVHIVFDDTGLLNDSWPMTAEITQPQLRLGEYFAIKPDIRNKAITVALEMHKHGWAALTVTLDEQTVTVSLSNVFPPFETMLEWVKRVSRADIPAQFDIDEEGTEKRLAVLSTNDPDRVLFRITSPYDDEEVFVEGIVSRSELVQAFKDEFLRFFWKEYDQNHWENEDNRDFPLKQKMLSDRWLSIQ